MRYKHLGTCRTTMATSHTLHSLIRLNLSREFYYIPGQHMTVSCVLRLPNHPKPPHTQAYKILTHAHGRHQICWFTSGGHQKDRGKLKCFWHYARTIASFRIGCPTASGGPNSLGRAKQWGPYSKTRWWTDQDQILPLGLVPIVNTFRHTKSKPCALFRLCRR